MNKLREKRLNKLREIGWIYGEDHNLYKEMYSVQIENLTNVQFGILCREIKKLFVTKITENGTELNPNTEFFYINQERDAYEHARIKRSYVGTCFNRSIWIGYYVPC